MKCTVPEEPLRAILERLDDAGRAYDARFPGESPKRQPVHTVYGGAHLFRFDTARRLGERALAALSEYAPDVATFAAVFDFTPESASAIRTRVIEKLEREPVEDFRLDFEDGYGHRPDAEEDATALRAAEQVARGMAEGTLPPHLGIRIKPLSRELAPRALRTLDLFLTQLLARSDGELPKRFVVTIPKVVSAIQVTAVVDAFEAFESRSPLEDGALQLELMVETPQSLIEPDGRAALPRWVDAARGRCVGAHFGVYDYTASCSITAEHQRMRHLTCDFARQSMLVSLAGRGIALSDGATNILPVPVHRARNGESLTELQRGENAQQVHRAWRLHFDDVRHSLKNGFYQGWDLHPAQLPTRYAALHSFFREGLDAATARLRNFIDMASQATLVGDVFDDAATGQGLLNYFLRGVNCGAITEEESLRTGLSLDELRGRSFRRIIEARGTGSA